MKNSNAIRKWKSLGFCLALFAGLFIGSCSDDDNDVPSGTTTAKVPYVCTTCPSSSEAHFGNDNHENGIYKGVFLDGTIEINFRNNQEKITGKVYFKNKTIELEESLEVILVDGRLIEGERHRVFLRGIGENKNVCLMFWVNDDGTNPEVSNFNLEQGEESVSCAIYKEKSKTLIETFEGNYYLVKNNTSSGDLAEVSERVYPGAGLQDDSTNARAIRLLLSRSGDMWVMFSVMVSNNGGSKMDYGKIVDGFLSSDVTGKKVAQLTADELNHKDFTDSGVMYLYAQRKR